MGVLSLRLSILAIVGGFVFSTGITWTKCDYGPDFAGYRCVPSETLFQVDNEMDPVTCGKKCHSTKECLSFFYQPDNHQCIGCRVHIYGPVWASNLGELPGSMYFSKKFNTNCKDILESDPTATSGLYDITIGGTQPLTVYCDMTTDGGGWTVFHNRFDGSVDFYRNFHEYENGFGDLNGEFWLGLRYIQILADKHPSDLRVVVTTADGVTAHEQFKNFRLLNGTDYRLSVRKRSESSGFPDRNIDYIYFASTNGSAFSTFDNQQDCYECAIKFHGGWWYGISTNANLNGAYCPQESVCETRNESNPNAILTMNYHLGFRNNKYETMKKSRIMLRRV